MRAKLLLIAIGLSLSACSSDAPLMSKTFLCETDSDCAEGYRCDRPPGQDADICVAQGAVFPATDASTDASPPEDAQTDAQLDASPPEDAQTDASPDASPPEDATTTPDAALQGEWTIAAGNNHVCAASPTGQIYCWGDNSLGQLGIGSSSGTRSTPQRVVAPTGTAFNAGPDTLAAGEDFNCALSRAAEVYCWGRNLLGQSDPTSDSGVTQPNRIEFPETLDFVAVAAGANHGCALSNTGRIFCWGSEFHGKRGHGPATRGSEPTEVLPGDLPTGAKFQQVVASSRNSCAATDSNQVYCWGNNISGQLGNNDETNSESDTPVQVSFAPDMLTNNIESLAAKHDTVLARTADGDVFCWGENANAQCGNGDSESGDSEMVPVRVDTTVSMETIALGAYHGCASSDSATYCWGSPGYGRLGGAANENEPVANEPVYSPNQATDLGRAFRELALGVEFSCGLTENDEVLCWGRNDYGQLGVGQEPSETSLPQTVDLPTQ